MPVMHLNHYHQYDVSHSFAYHSQGFIQDFMLEGGHFLNSKHVCEADIVQIMAL